MSLLALSGSALADARKDVLKKARAAMEAYDLLEYEDARSQLNAALVLAKKSRLGRDPVAATVHLYLAILNFSGLEDKEAAKVEFFNAVEIDPAVSLPKAYKTADMASLLEEVRAEFNSKAGGGTEEIIGPDGPEISRPKHEDIDCTTVEGLQHTLVDAAPANKSLELKAYLGKSKVARVSLFYRPEGSIEFTEVTMAREGTCGFVGEIPGSKIKGDVLHYYIAGLNKKGRPVVNKGDAGSPNLVEVTAAVAGDSDRENPFGGDGEVPNDKVVEDSVTGRGPRFFVSVAAGSGGGYVTGETESQQVKVECCFAPALLHVFPEIGYFFTRKTSASFAVRLGFPIGANVPGHATAAPSFLARVRHAFGADGTGFHVSGAAGYGIIRHTVKISTGTVGMDTDTTATGPVLVSAGAGYTKGLGSSLRLVAEANGIVGIVAGLTELGTCPGSGCVRPHFGLQVDLNLGLVFAF